VCRHQLSEYHHTIIYPKRSASLATQGTPKGQRNQEKTKQNDNSPNTAHILAHLIRIRPLQLAQLRATLDLEKHLLARRAHHLKKWQKKISNPCQTKSQPNRKKKLNKRPPYPPPALSKRTSEDSNTNLDIDGRVRVLRLDLIILWALLLGVRHVDSCLSDLWLGDGVRAGKCSSFWLLWFERRVLWDCDRALTMRLRVRRGVLDAVLVLLERRAFSMSGKCKTKKKRPVCGLKSRRGRGAYISSVLNIQNHRHSCRR